MKPRISAALSKASLLASALLAAPLLLAQEPDVQVHALILPPSLSLPPRTNAWLFLEGESAGGGDAWPDPARKSRTLFRTGQVPDDKWWGAYRAPDGTRMAMRGADLDHPWHRLIWDVSGTSIEPGLYDVHARVMVTTNGSCELAFTLGDGLPERPVSNTKSYINWVQVGTVEITDETRKAQLHVRTRQAAVRVDTVLLVKVEPAVVKAEFKAFDVTPPAWRKGDGRIFAGNSATLGFSSDTPEALQRVEAACRQRPADPFVFHPLAQEVDGTWRLKLDHPGWYDVQVKAIPAQGDPILRNTTVAILGESIPESRRRQSVFGLWNVHGDSELIRLAGARWNRRMTSFRDVTPEAAAAAAEAVGEVAPYDEKDGLAYVGVYSFGMPLWTMRMPDNARMPGFGNPFYPAKDWRDVANCVAAHARSNALPRAFSMYNEPLAHWKGSHAELVDYARAVRAGLKSVSPDFLVGGPGLYSIRIGDLEKLAQAGLLDVIDFIDMHAYVGGTPPEADFLDNLLALTGWLEAKGRRDKPVYLTEFGWTAAAGTWQPHVDRWTQTQYVARSLALGWSLGIDAMIYFVLDYRTKNSGEAAFSLFDEQGRPQPGYAAFSTVSKWFAGSTPIGHFTLTPATHLVLGYRDDMLQIGLWTTEGTESIRLPFAITRAVDLLGKPVAPVQPLTVTPDPLFLEAPVDGLRDLPVLPKIAGCDPSAVSDSDPFWPLEAMGTAPATLRSGSYAAFSKQDGRWRLLPFELVAPVHLESLEFKWPADAPHPRLVATLQSNVADATQTETIGLADKPEKKVRQDLPPNGRRIVHFNMTDAIPGRRNRSTVVRESADGRTVEHAIEWTAVSATTLANPGDWTDFTDWAPFGEVANTPDFDDCRGSLRLMHSDAGLHLQIRVTDDEHHQTNVRGDLKSLWTQDSLQIGFDMDVLKPWEAGFAGADASSTLGGHRIFEFAVAGAADGVSTNGVAYLQTSHDAALPADTAREGVRVVVTREGLVTTYHLDFPWGQLGVSSPMKPGDAFGFALAVNDIDPGRKARRHGIRLFDGIVNEKSPRQYGPVWLRR